jgi:hypothetical protein
MNYFHGTPTLQVKEWFLKEDNFESFDKDAELISLEFLSETQTVEKTKKLSKE